MQKIRPDMDIGKNIQAIRYKNNMTQDQVVVLQANKEPATLRTRTCTDVVAVAVLMDAPGV